MPPEQALIDRIRSFNRFYTNVLGLLDRHFLDTPFSLTEGRMLYEIATSEDCSARAIRARVDIDEGYLSRIVDKFVRGGWARKTPAAEDRRLHIIALTGKGRREFRKMNANSNRTIAQLIQRLSEPQRRELVSSMERIRELLGRTEG
jgi:DNA-binding MarR family transcriptional regulator